MRKWIVLAVVFLLLGVGQAYATIEYTVSLAQPENHLFHVTMNVQKVGGELQFQMPAWNALYQVRDFASRVQNVRAQDAQGAPLPVRKLDKMTWLVKGQDSLRISYDTYWDDGGPFNSQLNVDHAFLNFAMVLMMVPARRAEDVTVRFIDIPEGWKTALALPSDTLPNSYRASHYDALVDAPAEVGAFEEMRFATNGAKIRVVVHGTNWQRDPLLDMLQKIVKYETTLMREAPFPEYTFIFHLGSGSGGMEHSNCTAISSGSSLPAGVSAHEFFHLWNVKRIRPQSLEPVDYTKENWTRALWFAEGVTSTYGSYTLVRSGLWTVQQFYDDLGGELSTLQSRNARLWKSVEESSLDAWHEKYPLYNRPAFSLSYYNKGQILGVLLDILIRDATSNKKSLDDVLRDLNQTYAHKRRFYPESAGIRESAEKIAGRSFAEFFERYVAGTDELPYAEILKRAGLLVATSGTPRVRYEVSEDASASEKARRIRSGLLKGEVDP